MSDELAHLVETLASEAGDVTATQTSSGTEYVRSGQPFAAVAGGAAELRLLPDVAEAARRTPDTGSSGRGDEWVRFAPSAWDDHATDRLEAWFRVAWRMAGEGKLAGR